MRLDIFPFLGDSPLRNDAISIRPFVMPGSRRRREGPVPFTLRQPFDKIRAGLRANGRIDS
jgi:hypothetical protein